jgi:hypothetical protein
MWRSTTRAAALALMLPLPLVAQLRTAKPIGTIPTTTIEGATIVTTAPGPAPTGLAVITGTPAKATVSWNAAPNAVSYSVTRWLKSNPTCCRNAATNLTATTWNDDNGMLQWSGVYVYALSVTYADGTVGTAQIEWQRPEPYNPASLMVSQSAAGVADLSWTTVGTASYYLLWGPGIPDATKVTGHGTTTYRVSGIPSGTHEYTVGAYWEPGPVSTAASAFTRKRARLSGTATNTYRLSVNGFVVHNQTTENAFARDGAGNEVIAKAWFHHFDRHTKALLAKGGPQTQIHGDKKGFPFRILAGNASGTGGLQSGDVVPQGTDPARQPAGIPTADRFPFLIFEGPLTDYRDVVIVHPTLWEHDGVTSPIQAWSALVSPNGQEVNDFNRYGRDVDLAGLRLTTYGFALMYAQMSSIAGPSAGDILPDQDRLIGMYADPTTVRGPTWVDRAIILTREKAEEALAGQPWVILPFRLTDGNPNGDLKYDGDYTMYILVERVK